MTDLISRADAIEAVRSYFKDRMGKSKCDYDEELQVYVISKEERTMLTYNKGINDKLRSLPSAELPKGDLISRADVLKYPIRLDHYDEVNGNRVFVYGVESVIEYVESLPSADAVHGEWVDMEIPCNPYPPVFCVECSRCGYRVGRETFLENTFNFCPNCGARMKGGDSE